MPLSPRRIFALAIFGTLPLLVACPKKETPQVVDAAPPPPPVEDSGPVNIAALDDSLDAGSDADADAAPVKKGPYVNPNVARLKQCCNQLRSEAKRMGASPEGGMFLGAAAQCDVLATQAGASGTAPELGALRTLLQGRTIPPICSGF